MKQNLLPLLLYPTKRIYLTLAVILISLLSNAQELNYMTSIPSPNAASFTNAIDVPISLFSGKMNYKIPVYNLNEGSLNIPINLSYTASGFKPNAHPGWVGSGFSLNAGGVITRTKRGLNDDLFEMLHVVYSDPSISGIYSGFCYESGKHSNVFDDLVEKSGFTNLQTYNYISADTYVDDSQLTYDSEPDDFYFNFGSYSGKFIFDRNLDPIVVSNDKNLKVEIIGLYKEEYTRIASRLVNGFSTKFTPRVTSYSFSGFRIITDDGTVYEFGCEGGTTLKNVERSQDALSPNTMLTNDAWYLSKIISPSGEELASFEYLQNEWASNNHGLRNSLVNPLNNSSSIKPIRQLMLTRSLSYNGMRESNIDLSLGGKVIHPCYLSKISTKNSEISFYTSKSIEMEHHPTDIKLSLDNRYGAYFGDTGGMLDHLSTDARTDYSNIINRLTRVTSDGILSNHSINWMQLDSMTVKNKASQKKVKTSRFYYTHNKYERLRLLKYEENENSPYLFEYLNLHNRYVDGIELDNYSTFGNWWYGTTAIDNLGFFREGQEASPICPAGTLLFGRIGRFGDGGPNWSRENVPGYYYNYVRYHCYTKDYYDTDIYYKNGFIGPIALQTESDVLELEESLQNLKKGTYYNEETFNCSINTIHTPLGGKIEIEYEPHTIAKAIVRDYSNGEVSIEDRYRISVEDNYAHKDAYLSGIRVKSIKTYDANDESKYIKKEFIYDMGVLFKQTILYKLFFTGFPMFSHGGLDVKDYVHSFSTNSFAPGSTNDTGNYIGYSKVTETTTTQNGENNGKVVNYYSNSKDHPDLYTQAELDLKKDEHLSRLDEDADFSTNSLSSNNSFFPMSLFPASTREMKRGSLLGKITYDKNNNKVEQTKFEYLDPSDDLLDYGGIVATRLDMMTFDESADQGYPHTIFFKRDYHYPYFSNLLKKKTNTQYFGLDSITKVISYSYRQELSPMSGTILSKRLSTSTGDVLTTSYTYPFDYRDFSSAQPTIYDEMYEKNITSPIVTKIIKKEDKTIGGSLNTHRFGEVGKGESPDQILQDNSYQLIQKESLSNDLLFDSSQNVDLDIWDQNVELIRYDIYNNLLQYQKEDDINVSYIYGYNKTLPIAKINNIAYLQIPNIATLQSLSDADNDHGMRGSGTNEDALRIALDALRNIPGAMATTYTYDPLIGLTSITDFRGRTTYYEYDAFGKLKQVKDADGNILSKNEYHYKEE